MKKSFLVISIVLCLLSDDLFSQTNLIEKLLLDNKSLFENVLSNIDSFEVQIIHRLTVTRIIFPNSQLTGTG